MKTKLQEIRKSAGFKSARAFAEHIGMSVGTYTNYEQGKNGMDAEILWQFADALDCTVDELIGRETPKPNADDPVQKAIMDAYKSMNEHGRKRLAEEAMMMANSGMFDKSEDHKVSRTA